MNTSKATQAQNELTTSTEALKQSVKTRMGHLGISNFDTLLYEYTWLLGVWQDGVEAGKKIAGGQQ